eukprot:GHVN01097139.1.p1 GENE.GHVN01097139.1~~GHVN01097139.1.p1  ORF type:complete len:733 (+),score=104.77 GHVN01097139.1:705-2903(+)
MYNSNSIHHSPSLGQGPHGNGSQQSTGNSRFGNLFKNFRSGFFKKPQQTTHNGAQVQNGSRGGQPNSGGNTARNGHLLSSTSGVGMGQKRSDHQGLGVSNEDATRSFASTTTSASPTSVGGSPHSHQSVSPVSTAHEHEQIEILPMPTPQSHTTASLTKLQAERPPPMGPIPSSPHRPLTMSPTPSPRGDRPQHPGYPDGGDPPTSHAGTPVGGVSVAAVSAALAASPAQPSTESASPLRGSLATPDPSISSPASVRATLSGSPYDGQATPRDSIPPKSSGVTVPTVSCDRARPKAPPRFSWKIAKALVRLRMRAAETFEVNGVYWRDWELAQIPTLGASPDSCRVQEMFKVDVPATGRNRRPTRLFVKRIPIATWNQQWEAQETWNGEFVTDGENFVMEAAALAFLEQWRNGIAPELRGVLQLRGAVLSNHNRRPDGAMTQRESHDGVTHIVIVSELYGEDLLDFLDRRERENRPLTPEEKKCLQFHSLLVLNRLHSVGLAHLDFTPENLLIGREGIKLCDFAKATPLWSHRFRHVDPERQRLTSSDKESGHGTQLQKNVYHFESCEPTVGKGAYMPPECWRVYWKLEDTRVQYPLAELWRLTRAEDRVMYYFAVSPADVYMAGVLMFWIWAEGGVWRCSDPRQDDKYSHLVRSGLNFDLFRECRSWPIELKEVLQVALRGDPARRHSVEGLLNHKWFDRETSRGELGFPSFQQMVVGPQATGGIPHAEQR